MNILKFRRKAFAVALHLSLAAAAISASAQQSRPLSRDELIAAAREIMTTTRYCALITFDRAGRAQARTMDAFPPEENMSVWMATNPKSRKVAEIRRRPRVTLYYFDRQSEAYVTVHGTARLVSDANEKARHWKDEWQAFYPNRDKDYLLIEVRPVKLEVVNTKKGILGDPRTWLPPTVTFTWKRGRPRPQ
ncbi:MAG: pyridoxamine 5'-phosphate oxidase family protein [Pyrinomonadaceae bacterium]